jgi:hypothetical protein
MDNSHNSAKNNQQKAILPFKTKNVIAPAEVIYRDK